MKRKQQAYTLIEVMVVIAIIGLLSAIILTAMSRDKARMQIESVSREFSARVRAIQNDALTGKYVGNNIACGYIVDVDVAAGSYRFSRTLNTTCSTTGLNLCLDGKTPMNTVTLQGGVSVSGPTGVCFTIPFGKAKTISGVDIGATQKYTFSKAGSSHTRSVCVGTTGDITEVTGSTCP